MYQRVGIVLACLAVLLVIAVVRFLPQIPIETDLLALLPPTERNPLAEQAAMRLGQFTGERVVFLIGVKHTEAAFAAANRFAEGLQDVRLFRKVVARLPTPDPTALLDFYSPHQLGLIAPWQDDSTDLSITLSARLSARLAKPFGIVGALPLSEDPFGLFDDWLQSLPYRQFRLTPEDGWLIAREAEITWVLVSAELAGSAFDPILQKGVQARLNATEAILQKHWPGATVLRIGAIFHATAARMSAESEMHVIGLASLFGIVCLLLLAYRSLAPLLLGLLSVGAGICAAILITSWVFGRLHLITLVFGASLIGEVIDYAIQYFSARLGAGSEWDARHGLIQVLPALSIALATSVVGYAALAFTPFPALRQIAVFAMSGLIVAWLTVLWVIPRLLTKPQTWNAGPLLAWPTRWLVAWRAHMNQYRFLVFLGLAIVVVAPGWLCLTTDDDIHQLIQRSPELTHQEQRLRALAGLEAGSQFYVIEGDSAEQVLQREEALRAALVLHGVRLQGVSQFVPSCQQQTYNQEQWRIALPMVRQALEGNGFRSEAIDNWMARAKYLTPCLVLQDWLASSLSIPFQHLWMGQDVRGVAAIALPSGHTDVAQLDIERQNIPGVLFVDKASAVSRLFADYRQRGVLVLFIATALIFGVLTWRNGRHAAVVMLAPTLLAQAFTLGILGYMGAAINLFNLLALLLVLGVGINYAIFLHEGMRSHCHSDGCEKEPAVLVGVALSAATTLLSFGLLALSTTPALSGFAITLALGIGFSVFLAPIVLTLR